MGLTVNESKMESRLKANMDMYCMTDNYAFAIAIEFIFMGTIVKKKNDGSLVSNWSQKAKK